MDERALGLPRGELTIRPEKTRRKIRFSRSRRRRGGVEFRTVALGGR